MAGLVAPLVARYTMEGTYSDRPVANIVDMLITEDSTPVSRANAVLDQADFLLEGWVDHILENLVATYTFTGVSWVDLNTATGITGSIVAGPTSTLPLPGTAAGDGQPGNVAYRVRKVITAERGQRVGRMYLPGVGEADTATGTPNLITTVKQTAMDVDLAAFLADVNQSSLVNPLGYDSEMVVIHTDSADNPSPPPIKIITFDAVSPVQTLSTDLRLATQRRRLRS